MPQPSIAPLAPLTCRASTTAARCRRDHCCSAPRRAAPRSSGEGLREWLTSGRCSDHADARCSSAVRGTPSLAELATLRPTGFAPTVREAPVELQRRRPLRSKRQLPGISSACVCRSPPQIPCVRFPPHPATCRHGSKPRRPGAGLFSLRAWPRFDTVSCLDAAAGLSAPQIFRSDADPNPPGRAKPNASSTAFCKFMWSFA